MTLEEIRVAMIGKRLQTLYHGKVKTDWGEIVYIEHFNVTNSYRLSIEDDRCGHYLDADTVETLCRDGVVEKKNEYGKQYRLAENNEQ